MRTDWMGQPDLLALKELPARRDLQELMEQTALPDLRELMV